MTFDVPVPVDFLVVESLPKERKKKTIKCRDIRALLDDQLARKTSQNNIIPIIIK